MIQVLLNPKKKFNFSFKIDLLNQESSIPLPAEILKERKEIKIEAELELAKEEEHKRNHTIFIILLILLAVLVAVILFSSLFCYVKIKSDRKQFDIEKQLEYERVSKELE